MKNILTAACVAAVISTAAMPQSLNFGSRWEEMTPNSASFTLTCDYKIAVYDDESLSTLRYVLSATSIERQLIGVSSAHDHFWDVAANDKTHVTYSYYTRPNDTEQFPARVYERCPRP